MAARADEATHKAKAEEMISILHLDRMVNGVVQNAMQQTTALTQQRYGGNMTPAASAALADFQKKLSDTLTPQIGWDAIKPEYVRAFVEAFPEDQLDSMLAFYKSPAGKALLDKLPGIEQQVGGVLQKRVQDLQPQVRQMFDDFQKNLPPRTPPSLGTPPDAPPASAPPASSSPSQPTPPTSTPK